MKHFAYSADRVSQWREEDIEQAFRKIGATDPIQFVGKQLLTDNEDKPGKRFEQGEDAAGPKPEKH